MTLIFIFAAVITFAGGTWLSYYSIFGTHRLRLGLTATNEELDRAHALIEEAAQQQYEMRTSLTESFALVRHSSDAIDYLDKALKKAYSDIQAVSFTSSQALEATQNLQNITQSIGGSLEMHHKTLEELQAESRKPPWQRQQEYEISTLTSRASYYSPPPAMRIDLSPTSEDAAEPSAEDVAEPGETQDSEK